MGAGSEFPEGERTPETLADPVSQRPRFFNFDAQAVRVVGTAESPWFIAKDVCAVLEIGNSRQSLATLEDDEKGVSNTDTLGGPQELATVNESGLYALIFRSRKPQARLFRRWVTAEVLPAIRKTGAYVVTPPAPAIEYERPRPADGLVPVDPKFPEAIGMVHTFSVPRPPIVALLPGRSPGYVPLPDLVAPHVSRLLSEALNHGARWSGTILELATIARAHALFWWILRDPEDSQQRAELGMILRRRIATSYMGFGGTEMRLAIVGRGRQRRYLIERGGVLP